MASPHVHVLVSENGLPPAVAGAIARLGASASFGRLGDALRNGARSRADAIVIVENEELAASRLSAPLLRRIVGPFGGALVVHRDQAQVRTPMSAEPMDEPNSPDEANLTERLGRLIERTTRAAAALKSAAAEVCLRG